MEIRVSQNAPKCFLASIEVHVAAIIPQVPPKRKICRQTIFALISCRKVESTQLLCQIAAFLLLFPEIPTLATFDAIWSYGDMAVWPYFYHMAI